MSKHYLKAKLTSWRKINVVLFTDIPRPNSVYITLYKNGKFYKKEKISRINSIVQLYFFDISLICNMNLLYHNRKKYISALTLYLIKPFFYNILGWICI